MDPVERRLLKGETIPHEEKVFSIFEEHTRWVSKGKAGTPVELGVPVCVMEDQFQFILHHKILWAGGDVDLAAPMVEERKPFTPTCGCAASIAVFTARRTVCVSTSCST